MRRLVWVICALALCGCERNGRILVTIEASLRVPESADELELTAEPAPAGEPFWSRSFPLSPASNQFPNTLALDSEPRATPVRIRAVAKLNRVAVARAEATGKYTSQVVTQVTIRLVSDVP